jgi:hypothetical protein
MPTKNSSNRKPKGDGSKTSITGVSNAEWDEFLDKELGAPNSQSKPLAIQGEPLEFLVYAREKGYSFNKIRKALKTKFDLAVSENTCNRTYRVAKGDTCIK